MNLNKFLVELREDSKFLKQLEIRKNVVRPTKLLKKGKVYSAKLVDAFNDYDSFQK